MNYDHFVLPFTLGLVILLIIVLYKFSKWIIGLNSSDKKKLGKGIFGLPLLFSVKEIFLESLLHRKVFKANAILGYMHMSLAFGWFLLIVIGNIESKLYSDNAFNPPYYPIFLQFFVENKPHSPIHDAFTFIMDFVLLIVLSGVLLAFTKRIYSKLFGMKRTTKMKIGDKLALTSLWLIFPLRFLAESFTSGTVHNGGFLTDSAGIFFANFLPVQDLAYITWWGYSWALGLFFISVPFSRYMHIPAEILLIFARNSGIKTEKKYNSFSEIEVNSCPRCGLCLDTCQLASAANITYVQSVYFIRSIRENEIDQKIAFNCLLCGRCENICPVGINLNGIRTAKRSEFTKDLESSFDYIKPTENQSNKTDVLYFAGCMTHLTPTIKKSMTNILNQSGVNYQFMDADGSICCGRPMLLAGNIKAAEELMRKNKAIIEASGAKTLVTSCPICYKTFKEDYNLNINIVHHSQYLLTLIEEKKIKVNKTTTKQVVYHDPCELGRESGIYNEPRNVIEQISSLQSIKNEKVDSLCCGGSLGNLQISSDQKDMICNDTLASLTANNPDTIITACPLCKKTFAKNAAIPVIDLSELVSDSLVK